MAEPKADDMRLGSGLTRSRVARFRIGPLLAVAQGGSTFVVVAVVLVVMFMVAVQSTEELLDARASLLVDTMIQRFDDRLSMAREEMDYLHDRLRSEGFGGNALADIAGEMRTLVSSSSLVAGMSAYGRDGLMVAAMRQSDGQPTIWRVWPYGPRSEEAEHLQEITTEPPWDGVEWLAPEFEGDDRLPVLPVQQVIRGADGQTLGVIRTLLSVYALSNLIDQLVVEDDIVPFMLFGDDWVMAHPAFTETNREIDKTRPLPLVRHFPDPVLAQWPGEDVARLPNSTIELSEVFVDGTSFLFLYRTLNHDMLPVRMGVHIQLPWISDDEMRLLLAGGVGLSFAALGVIMALVVGRRFSRSVQEVAEGAREAARLDVKALQSMPRSRVQEFDETGLALRAMGRALDFATRYIPRQLVLKLLARSGGEPASEIRELTILFTDLQGFTSRSEHLSAEAVAERLNGHFAYVCDAIEAEDGTVDKFLGDGVMAFWGAPDAMSDHAERAVRAAATMAAAHARVCETHDSATRMRIGVHTGEVVVGNIGGGSRLNYTIIGDAVNTASRLEGLGKEFSLDRAAVVLMSDQTREKLEGNWRLIERGDHAVKGREAHLRIWELDYA